MSEPCRPRVAIVDYGMGNLFSVKHACEAVGLSAFVTSDRTAVCAADAVIVPGVGAFGDAMATLRRLDLVSPLRDIAAAGRPIIGVCLGLQLFMSESEEFGRHVGFGFFTGPVVRFNQPRGASKILKVPQVGWNRIQPSAGAASWMQWPLTGLVAGEFMYFVHSFYAQPADPGVVLSTSRYGHIDFCSSVLKENIFACQFHPERSGPEGLKIYRNIATHIHATCHRRNGASV